jgi:hypothetical protein
LHELYERDFVMSAKILVPSVLSFLLASPIAAGTLNQDFKDALGDDKGDGLYTYPAGVPAGSADLCRVSFEEFGETFAVTVGVKAFSPNTRVAVVLFDEAAYTDTAREWAIGGTELKLPNWTDRGAAFILGLPASESPLFDINVTQATPVDAPTPDNVIYVEGGPAAWIAEDGGRSQDPSLAFRMQPQAVQDGDCQSYRYEFPKKLLDTYLPALADESAALYAAAYSYVVVESGANEFGAFELTSAQGASDSWEDADVYDIAFTGAESAQDQLLKVSGEGEEAVVQLQSVDAGIARLR